MTFVSYEFGLFLLACLLFYWGACLRFARWRVGFLFAVSGLFLWFAGGVRSVAWYSLSAASVWAGALGIDRWRKHKARLSRWVFMGALALNLALLAVFRYVNFPGYTMEEIHWLAGGEWEWTPVFLTAPLAISFYTLTLSGYLIEVYWGTVQPEKNPLKLALFGGFFPQMVVGPVARHGRLSCTLFEGNRLSCGENLRSGFMQVVWGLFKKLVIAERLAVLVNTVYGDSETYGGGYLALAAVCFVFQLYTDFGGAVDMAAGMARMFGVELERNFRQPFFSRSVAEFWRRWHMTLGGWFKDFVLYPLLKTRLFQKLGTLGRAWFGKKQGKKLPTVAGLFFVWFLLGLWHGGKWTFIIGSGLYHAALMSLALVTEPMTRKFYKKTGLNPDHPFWIAFQRLRTFVLVTVGFVFFRSDSLAMTADIFAGMFMGEETAFNLEGILSLGLPVADLAVLILAMILLAAVSVRKEHVQIEESQKEIGQGRENPGLGWCLCLAFFVLIFGYYGRGYDSSAFIYAQF